MKLYAELPALRSRQAVFDLLLVAWCWAWIRLGMYMNDLVEKLSAAGRMLIGAGEDLEDTASSVQGTVVRVPVLGRFLKERFDGLVGVGQSLQDSGNSQVDTVNTLSMWIGIIVALLPILLALAVWLRRRVGWIRDASTAARLREDPENLYLFALRAISNRPLTELRSNQARQAIRAFHAGDYAPLARMELEQMGLRYR